MGLPKNKLTLTRKDVESGKVGKYSDEEYHLYARHGKLRSCETRVRVLANNSPDKPDELLESDSKYPSGHNPVIGEESKANK
jgi:glycerol-3-phosphate dehydrogenase